MSARVLESALNPPGHPAGVHLALVGQSRALCTRPIVGSGKPATVTCEDCRDALVALLADLEILL
jgi:hypothetical protein